MNNRIDANNKLPLLLKKYQSYQLQDVLPGLLQLEVL